MNAKAAPGAKKSPPRGGLFPLDPRLRLAHAEDLPLLLAQLLHLLAKIVELRLVGGAQLLVLGVDLGTPLAVGAAVVVGRVRRHRARRRRRGRGRRRLCHREGGKRRDRRGEEECTPTHGTSPRWLWLLIRDGMGKRAHASYYKFLILSKCEHFPAIHLFSAVILKNCYLKGTAYV